MIVFNSRPVNESHSVYYSMGLISKYIHVVPIYMQLLSLYYGTISTKQDNG